MRNRTRTVVGTAAMLLIMLLCALPAQARADEFGDVLQYFKDHAMSMGPLAGTSGELNWLQACFFEGRTNLVHRCVAFEKAWRKAVPHSGNTVPVMGDADEEKFAMSREGLKLARSFWGHIGHKMLDKDASHNDSDKRHIVGAAWKDFVFPQMFPGAKPDQCQTCTTTMGSCYYCVPPCTHCP